VTLNGLNEEEIRILAGLAETPAGRAALRAIRLEQKKAESASSDPRLNTERIRDDFRYQMGEAHGLACLSRLIKHCRQRIGIQSGDEA